MALLIEKNVTILGNIDVSTLYVRMGLVYNVEGNSVEAVSSVYPSRASYDAGSYQNSIRVDGILSNYQFDYDRAVDGSDLLTAIHTKFKTLLSTDEVEDVPVLDPSTGEPTYDPSTGELITEEAVVTPKFAEDSSISFIDID
jgi:hypothetical protein